MALEHTIQLAFAPHLEVTREQWTERYVDVLVDGLRDALQTGDASLVLGSLRKSASDLVVAGRLRVAVELYRTIANKLQSSTDASLRGVVSELTDSMFGGDTLRILLDQVIADPDLADALDVVLAQLSANVLPVILAALQRSFPPAVRTALLKFIERSIQGYEETLVEAIPGLDPVVLFPLLDLLNRLKTPAAREALVSLTKNKDIAVRIEAKVLCATSPEAAEEELVSLLQDKAIGVRIAALRAIARHDMKKTVAAVTRRIHGSDFGNLTLEERRELFITVLRLAPDRGEALALETAKKGGLFSSESRELTRCAAIDALGAVSASLQVAHGPPRMKREAELPRRWRKSRRVQPNAGRERRDRGHRYRNQRCRRTCSSCPCARHGRRRHRGVASARSFDTASRLGQRSVFATIGTNAQARGGVLSACGHTSIRAFCQ